MSYKVAMADNKKKSHALPEHIFSTNFNEALIHQVVTSMMTNMRAGTKKQLTRAEVRGGGAKPWNQKGTGRARAGTIRSPLWRKGGKVFAARPRTFDDKINKKMYRLAMKSIIAELHRQERLLVVENLTVPAMKTKQFISLLENINPELKAEKLLILTSEFDEQLYMSSRNLPNIRLYEVVDIDPVSLVAADKVILTVPALAQLEGMLS